jgi:peptide-methionine (S)-S-oxide reductase
MSKKKIVLGGGCFWCLEAVYQRVRGVEAITSGYAGGSSVDPTYYGHADHAEVIKISYDDSQIDLGRLLEIFFTIHDPTTLNRQGADVGSQYRSIILPENDKDLETAEQARTLAAKDWNEPIVTEIKLLDIFYPAEDYHQNFYNQNQSNPYCQVVINPKLKKFEENFADVLQ